MDAQALTKARFRALVSDSPRRNSQLTTGGGDHIQRGAVDQPLDHHMEDLLPITHPCPLCCEIARMLVPAIWHATVAASGEPPWPRVSYAEIAKPRNQSNPKNPRHPQRRLVGGRRVSAHRPPTSGRSDQRRGDLGVLRASPDQGPEVVAGEQEPVEQRHRRAACRRPRFPNAGGSQQRSRPVEADTLLKVGILSLLRPPAL
jgi:hypothetical protein